MMRLLAMLVAVALTTAHVRADEPPKPPATKPVALAAGTSWTAPKDGGLCLDKDNWQYQVAVRNYYETRIKVTEEVAERQGWKGAIIGFSAGVVVGGLVALARR